MGGPPAGEELRKQYRAMHRRAQEAEAIATRLLKRLIEVHQLCNCLTCEDYNETAAVIRAAGKQAKSEVA
jgi:hypothetical protein